jgi:hypothetical protein
MIPIQNRNNLLSKVTQTPPKRHETATIQRAAFSAGKSAAITEQTL